MLYAIHFENVEFIYSLPWFNLPYRCFSWLTPPGPYRAMTCRKRELSLDYIHPFLTRQGHRGPHRMGDQFNAGATSEITRTWKTIHIINAPSLSNKVNMQGWLWLPNGIRGPCGPKVFRHLSYRWGKNPKTSPRKLFPTGDRTRTRCVTSAHATACSTAVYILK